MLFISYGSHKWGRAVKWRTGTLVNGYFALLAQQKYTVKQPDSLFSDLVWIEAFACVVLNLCAGNCILSLQNNVLMYELSLNCEIWHSTYARFCIQVKYMGFIVFLYPNKQASFFQADLEALTFKAVLEGEWRWCGKRKSCYIKFC